ncbi:protein containing PKD domain-containing protein [Pseudalgibacter alginicilyticus]|uniref:Protein containing PKD domain-containing protein n=1 Tax=Pseudalgibacter alginicilyticus TaxID=1736674 RepID=A0A0P0CV76_9FLAO|nr:DUF4625 domain-containing protein [Pseudalgibacter alginicilyticus]ALJ06843.1 protein containing PKD domain-containing protein [Pseudalgibacter alginicilyticus]
MKTNFKFLAIIAFLGTFLYSCSSDDDSSALNAPVISNFEYGEGSEHSTDPVAYIGSDIHLEAEISAEATVSSITLIIHDHDLEVGEGEEKWSFEQVFTKESYLVINPTFHEHVDVPSTAPEGEYHIELIVTDALGNITEVEGHIEILHPITISDFSIDSTVARGDDFHVEFMIDAVNGIHSIFVDMHADGLSVGEGEEEFDYEYEYLGDYHEQTSVEFHEHIDVAPTAPAGEYHIIFTVEDEDGNTKEYETHIDVTAPVV